MQITRQDEYAIRTVFELAKLEKGEFIDSKTVARRQDLPEKFLNKTVQILARSGLVESRRGMQGGIRLAIGADRITMADVIEAIEGKIAINPCLAENYYCERMPACQVHRVLKRTQSVMLKELNRESFADLVKEEKKAKSLLSI